MKLKRSDEIFAILMVLAVAFAAPAAADEKAGSDKKDGEPADEDDSSDDEWIEKWQPVVLTDAAFNWVSDDDHRYQYYFQKNAGAQGGLREFSARRLEADGDLQFHAKGLYKDELGVGGRFEKFGLGYIEGSFEQYPRYYDASDVHYFWNPQENVAELEGDAPQLDLGRFALEGGLKKENLPQIRVGYERLTDKGETDLPYGGQQIPAMAGIYGDPENAPLTFPNDLFHAYVTPLEQKIDLVENHFYANASHTIEFVDVSVRGDWRDKRGEKFLEEPWYMGAGSTTTNIVAQDREFSQRTATMFFRSFPDQSVWSLGGNVQVRAIEDVLKFEFDYQYTRSENDSQLETDVLRPDGVRYWTNHGFVFLPGTDASNDANEHRYRLRAEATPVEYLTTWAEVTNTYERTEGESTRLEDNTEAIAPPAGTSILLADEIWFHDTVVVEKTWREETGLRLTALPMTTVTLISAFEQSDVDYDWHADFMDGPDTTIVPDEGNWYWRADGDYARFQGTARITIKPREWVALHPYYQYQYSDYQVTENDRYYERKVGDPEYTILQNDRYYPGQIRDLFRYQHTVGIAADLIPSSMVKLRPRWEYRRLTERKDDERYDQHTGRFRSTELGLGIDYTPVEHFTLTLDGTVRYSETRTPANKYSFSEKINAVNGTVNARNWRGGMVDKFESGYWSVAAGAQYEIDSWTLGANFTHTDMDGSWATRVVTMDAGLGYKFDEHWRGTVMYQFADYDERENGNKNDFQSHTGLVGVEFR